MPRNAVTAAKKYTLIVPYGNNMHVWKFAINHVLIVGTGRRKIAGLPDMIKTCFKRLKEEELGNGILQILSTIQTGDRLKRNSSTNP